MKRQANFEVLRVVAMGMIVTMHFMHVGQIIEPLSKELSVVNSLAWLLETFCNVAANCYVLIAGYFLVGTEWKTKKLMKLVAQILLYSLLIPLVCMLFGIGDVSSWTVYEWIVVVLPLQMDHYWFATAYVLMFLLSPVLAMGVKQISKKQLEWTIGLLLIYFCVFKSVSPILLSTDNYGYDYPWFICLFLIAAYIRLYEQKDGGLQIGQFHLWASGKKSILAYFIIGLFTFTLSIVLGVITSKIGKFDYFMDMMYSYNHVLTLLTSVSLFFAFKYWQPKESKGIRYLCGIAPYTFGVYLIHENIAIRNLWPDWFGVENVRESILFVPYLLFVVVVVFAVCVSIDCVRKKVFDKIG